MKRVLSACLAVLLLLWAGSNALAQQPPAPVTIGVYVNKIQDLNFRENKYALDFFIWFLWKPQGELIDYRPLDSFEIMNGSIDGKSSVVEKTIGDLRYASARISATMAETWKLKWFPFDWHRSEVRIEDSVYPAESLQFVPDKPNSALGDEIDMPGWDASKFDASVVTYLYRTNYGDISLPTAAESRYSRFIASWDIHRQGWGGAVKLLLTVFLATSVVFVSYMVRPSDLDARFGMAVGGLFAVVASAVVVSQSTPDSGAMTVADQMHLVALGFIFVTLLESAYALRVELSGEEKKAYRIDHWALGIMPLLFFGWAAWTIWRALHA
jgi:hypothetical protein